MPLLLPLAVVSKCKELVLMRFYLLGNLFNLNHFKNREAKGWVIIGTNLFLVYYKILLNLYYLVSAVFQFLLKLIEISLLVLH